MQARNEQRQKTLIDNELNKFRHQLSNRPKSRAGSRKSQLLINLPTKLDDSLSLANISTIENNTETKDTEVGNEELDYDAEEYINKFYAEIVTASPSDKSRLTTTPQDESPESTPPYNKMVRFGDNVEIIHYERESSASSFSSLSSNSEVYLEMVDSDNERCSSGSLYGFKNLKIDKHEPEIFRSITKKFTTTKFDGSGIYYSENTIEMTDNFLKITKYENCKKCEEINFYGEHIFDHDRDHYDEIIEIEPSETKKYVSRDNEQRHTDDRELMVIKRMDIEPKDYSNLIVKNGYRFEEKDKIIEELFEKKELKAIEEPQDFKIIRWAFKQWHQNAVIGKITRETTVSKKDRMKKINEFLNKINIEKRHFFNEAVRKALASQKHIDSVTLKKNYEHK